MNKAVLLSIQPRWCELIASGKKTVEVRKTRPNLKTPFKVFIYAIKQKHYYKISDHLLTSDENLYLSDGKIEMSDCFKFWNSDIPYRLLNCKVIGEFVCDEITPLFNVATTSWSLLAGNVHEYAKALVRMARLTEEEMHSYAKGKNCYAWHISNLVIYAEPKPLSNFIIPSKVGCCNEGKCKGCEFLDKGNGFNVEDDCNARFNTDEYKPLRKAPQSWCYVEELK